MDQDRCAQPSCQCCHCCHCWNFAIRTKLEIRFHSLQKFPPGSIYRGRKGPPRAVSSDQSEMRKVGARSQMFHPVPCALFRTQIISTLWMLLNFRHLRYNGLVLGTLRYLQVLKVFYLIQEIFGGKHSGLKHIHYLSRKWSTFCPTFLGKRLFTAADK